jgi:hypothetical protein
MSQQYRFHKSRANNGSPSSPAWSAAAAAGSGSGCGGGGGGGAAAGAVLGHHAVRVQHTSYSYVSDGGGQIDGNVRGRSVRGSSNGNAISNSNSNSSNSNNSSSTAPQQPAGENEGYSKLEMSPSSSTTAKHLLIPTQRIEW